MYYPRVIYFYQISVNIYLHVNVSEHIFNTLKLRHALFSVRLKENIDVMQIHKPKYVLQGRKTKSIIVFYIYAVC